MNKGRLKSRWVSSWLSRAALPSCARAAAAASLIVLGVTACGGGDGTRASAKSPESSRPETLQHEECSESGHRVELLDTNGDGKPDIRRVFDGSGHELCQVGDLNHDGKPEMYEYFDAAGAVRRREFCYDDTGVVNAVEHYEKGKLVSREFASGGQQRIDTWDFFDPSVAPDPKTGRPLHPSRRERDTTGHGHVDQWWTWNGDKITIAVDSGGAGKPDQASAITLGGSKGENGVLPASSAGQSPVPAPTPTPTPSAPPSASTRADGGTQ